MKERIKQLCKEKSVSMNLAEKEMGLARGYISKIGKTNPNTKTLQKIASYFNVSEQYLITGKEAEFTVEMAETDVALSNMSKKQKEYALKLADLPNDKQEHIMQLIDMLSNDK